MEQNLFEKLDHLDARPAGDSPLAVAEVTELLGEARARVDELHAQGTSKAQARSAAAKGFWGTRGGGT